MAKMNETSQSKTIRELRIETYGLFVDLVDQPASLALDFDTGNILLNEGEGDNRFDRAMIEPTDLVWFQLSRTAVNDSWDLVLNFDETNSHNLGALNDVSMAIQWLNAANVAVRKKAHRRSKFPPHRSDSTPTDSVRSHVIDSKFEPEFEHSGGFGFASFLVRQHWLKKDEFLSITWRALKGFHGETKGEYLEPCLRELVDLEIEDLLPFRSTDVLVSNRELMENVFLRAGLNNIDELLSYWRRWHSDNLLPMSSRSAADREDTPAACWLAHNVMNDDDRVFVMQGRSAIVVALAALAHRRDLTIITSDRRLICESLENPMLVRRAKSFIVLGGDLLEDASGGLSLSGESIRSMCERELMDKPGATVVIMPVSRICPKTGPIEATFALSFQVKYAIDRAARSNVRRIVLLAHYTQVCRHSPSDDGEPVFLQRGEWERFIAENAYRVSVVVTAPEAVGMDPELKKTPPRMRVIDTLKYSLQVTRYLMLVAEMDELCTSVGSAFVEVTSGEWFDTEVAFSR
jgi:hypothetical protein